jgi:N-terminal domain of anti-restriction factor ArdC
MKTRRKTLQRRASATNETPSWADLLRDAVKKPGRILAAYRAFHEYSVGNQLAAYSQCVARGLPLGPVGTYRQWTARGRQVKRGEKALWLCVPRTVRSRGPPKGEDQEIPEVGEEDASGELGDGDLDPAGIQSRVVFSWQPRWFVLGQTEGDDFVLPEVPAWDRDRALRSLGVTVIPFAHLDGNVQGYAEGRSVAVNPFAALPVKTLFHELGHVLLHQVGCGVGGSVVLERYVREVEAEAVALVCVEALGLPGAEFARGYIQAWLAAGMEFPEHSAQRIMGAADRIIRAGTTGVAGRTAA